MAHTQTQSTICEVLFRFIQLASYFYSFSIGSYSKPLGPLYRSRSSSFTWFCSIKDMRPESGREVMGAVAAASECVFLRKPINNCYQFRLFHTSWKNAIEIIAYIRNYKGCNYGMVRNGKWLGIFFTPQFFFPKYSQGVVKKLSVVCWKSERASL